MNLYIALIVGIVCAAVGGELFVRGTVGLATWARICAGIVGATVAAFGTSSPELSVAVIASLAGNPDIALGGALGSNVVNVALILGASLLLGSMRSPRHTLQRDISVAIIAPIATGLLALDGMLSRLDGFILLAGFAFWMAVMVRHACEQRSAAADELGTQNHWHAVVYSVIGLGLLILAGQLIVTGAVGLAAVYRINTFIVGAIIVAIGTSVPEFATTFMSKLRGHDEVGVGTILGSNIFNGLLIIPVAAIIAPIRIDGPPVAIALLFGLLTVLCTIPNAQGVISRWRGILLIALYAVYLFLTLKPV